MASPIDAMSPEDAPDWFWSLIERSHGDRERLRELAGALSRDQLQQAFEYYRMLASYVMPDDLDEDPALDLANWVVAQGKALYFGVYRREVTPLAATDDGAGFRSVLLAVHWERFREDLV